MHHVDREVVLLVPGGDVRGDLGVREVAYDLAELLVFASKAEGIRHAAMLTVINVRS